MSIQPTIRATNSNEWRYLGCVTLPPLLVTALFAFGAIQEHRAAESVQTAIADLTPEQRPAYVSWRDNYFGTSVDDRSGSQSWLRLEMAANEVTDQIDAFARHKTDQRFWMAPGDSWPEAAILEQILVKAQPIIDQIVTMIAAGQTAQNEYSIFELLRQQLRMTIYREDHERTLTTLHAIHRLTRQLDQFHQQQHAIRNTEHEAIRATLAFDFWQSPDQIEQLREMTAEPIQLPEDWAKMVQRARRLLVANIDITQRSSTDSSIFRFSDRFGMPAIAQQYAINQFDDFDDLPDSGVIDQFRWTNELRNYRSQPYLYRRHRSMRPSTGSLATMTLTGVPLADGKKYIYNWMHDQVTNQMGMLAELEYQRLVTQTLIAIKQFQQQEDRWPEDLHELSAVGVPAVTWSTGIESLFSIKLTDDGEDAVLVWPPNVLHAMVQLAGRKDRVYSSQHWMPIQESRIR